MRGQRGGSVGCARAPSRRMPSRLAAVSLSLALTLACSTADPALGRHIRSTADPALGRQIRSTAETVSQPQPQPQPEPIVLDGASVAVRWRNLDDLHVVRVVVRRVDGTLPPASPTDGTP